MMFKKSKVDRILELQREQREARETENNLGNETLPQDTGDDRNDAEMDYYPLADDSDEEIERRKKLKKVERKENMKNIFSMMIAAVLVFLPAMLVLVAAFLRFIWLFFRGV